MILPERVRAELAAATRFADIRLLDETDSTNRVVLEEARRGADEGLVVVADVQTSGRGRLDRTWEAEPGAGLLVSVLLRPRRLAVERWHLLTAAAGLAAQAACEQVARVRPDLKWPNDLMIGDQKLAGILAEVAAPAPDGAVVVGMGLNVHSGPPGSAWLDRAAGHRISRADLLPAWLSALEARLDRWTLVAQEYHDGCCTVGQEVVIDQLDGVRLRGQADSIDEAGRLLVRTDSGEMVPISVGDVTHLRPSGR